MRKIIAGLFITLDGVDQCSPLTLTHARAHGNGVIALRYTLGHAAVATTLSEVPQCAS